MDSLCMFSVRSLSLGVSHNSGWLGTIALATAVVVLFAPERFFSIGNSNILKIYASIVKVIFFSASLRVCKSPTSLCDRVVGNQPVLLSVGMLSPRQAGRRKDSQQETFASTQTPVLPLQTSGLMLRVQIDVATVTYQC